MWGFGPANENAAKAGFGFQNDDDMELCNGVAWQRSQVTLRDISDGQSNTYLVGEKYLNPDDYFTGIDHGDDEPALGADDLDLNRWTYVLPKPDQRGLSDQTCFGSAHPGSFNMALCDGSVRGISYEITLETHRILGNRRDGETIDKTEL